MKQGDWFLIFLSIAVVLIAVLGAITRTQSVTGPAIAITHTQSSAQVAPKRTTQK